MNGKARIVEQAAYESRLDQQRDTLRQQQEALAAQQAYIQSLEARVQGMGFQQQHEEAAWTERMKAATAEAARHQFQAQHMTEQNEQQKQYINKLEEREDKAKGKGRGKGKGSAMETSDSQSEEDDEPEDGGDSDFDFLFNKKDGGTDDEMAEPSQNKPVRLINMKLTR